MRRTILLVLAAMVALCALTGCGSKPSAVVEEFYTLLGDGKVNDAYELITKESSSMLDSLGGSAALMAITEDIQEKKGIKKFEVTSEEIHGDTAKLKYKITFGDGSTREDDESLLKTDDGWRIVASK